MTEKIATHDSATGESPKNFLSWLLIPFARTQSKTIQEQYNAGCRSFDIRVKEDGNAWYCAHGPFKTERTADSIIAEINSFGRGIQMCITYEGKATNNVAFLNKVHEWKSVYTNIIYGSIAVKYGDASTPTKVLYSFLEQPYEGYSGGAQGFLPLDGRSWHTYIPIPWLWKKIYFNTPKFNGYNFTYVDFL